MVGRGEVCWLELKEEGRRPVVVLTREATLPGLRNVVVALITRSIGGIETEVEIGPEDGMPVICAISLDNLRTVPQALLVASITDLGSAKMDEVRRALVRSTGADSHVTAEQRPRRVDLTTSDPVENRTPADTRFRFEARTDQILDLRATG